MKDGVRAHALAFDPYIACHHVDVGYGHISTKTGCLVVSSKNPAQMNSLRDQDSDIVVPKSKVYR
jgi:hypothetical protein